MRTIQVRELSEQLERGVLVDVRTPAEHGEVHIPGAHLMPLHELEAGRIRAVVPPGQACYVVCRSGQRARQAAMKLEEAGVPDVVVVEGGVMAWEAAGYRVNRGRAVMSIERQGRVVAGLLVVTGVLLGFLIAPAFFVLSGLVGCGLALAGLTDCCALGILLARMPWNNRVPAGGASCAC